MPTAKHLAEQTAQSPRGAACRLASIGSLAAGQLSENVAETTPLSAGITGDIARLAGLTALRIDGRGADKGVKDLPGVEHLYRSIACAARFLTPAVDGFAARSEKRIGPWLWLRRKSALSSRAARPGGRRPGRRQADGSKHRWRKGVRRNVRFRGKAPGPAAAPDHKVRSRVRNDEAWRH
ncbi:hypothetical protein GCM10019059_31370 [Camelimonas fluminis]|nr:hypothetical protein GCM10019059_31370 [Camelimonas fluminis]